MIEPTATVTGHIHDGAVVMIAEYHRATGVRAYNKLSIPLGLLEQPRHASELLHFFSEATSGERNASITTTTGFDNAIGRATVRVIQAERHHSEEAETDDTAPLPEM